MYPITLSGRVVTLREFRSDDAAGLCDRQRRIAMPVSRFTSVVRSKAAAGERIQEKVRAAARARLISVNANTPDRHGPASVGPPPPVRRHPRHPEPPASQLPACRRRT